LQDKYEDFNLKTQDGGVPKTIRRAVYPTRALKGSAITNSKKQNPTQWQWL
jgi:hypothetical protein